MGESESCGAWDPKCARWEGSGAASLLEGKDIQRLDFFYQSTINIGSDFLKFDFNFSRIQEKRSPKL